MARENKRRQNPKPGPDTDPHRNVSGTQAYEGSYSGADRKEYREILSP
jgi:hypothetical protein